MQQTGEGTLTIPPGWRDSTVNIYTEKQPGARGLSVTINRDELATGNTLDDYVEAQTQKLRAQLQQFQMLAHERLLLQGYAAHLLEFTWQSKDVGEIHQFLMTLFTGKTVLNFAGTSPGRMTDRQRADLGVILRSFQPDQPD